VTADEDKRRDPRRPIKLVVDYEGAEDLIGDYTENLSSGGTFLVTNRELPIGTRVSIVLSFPGLLEPIAIAGTVRWTRGQTTSGSGVGIEFEPGAARDELAAAIERVRDRDPRMVARVIELLVVEDNPHIAELIEHGLRGSMRRDATCPAFSIRTVPDGRSALEALQSARCDLMIIDVYLPIIDGSRVISAARGALGRSDLAIIAFSGGGESARDAAMDAGANVFLDKPIRLRQVLETIQRLMH